MCDYIDIPGEWGILCRAILCTWLKFPARQHAATPVWWWLMSISFLHFYPSVHFHIICIVMNGCAYAVAQPRRLQTDNFLSHIAVNVFVLLDLKPNQISRIFKRNMLFGILLTATGQCRVVNNILAFPWCSVGIWELSASWLLSKT